MEVVWIGVDFWGRKSVVESGTLEIARESLPFKKGGFRRPSYIPFRHVVLFPPMLQISLCSPNLASFKPQRSEALALLSRTTRAAQSREGIADCSAGKRAGLLCAWYHLATGVRVTKPWQVPQLGQACIYSELGKEGRSD
jgi:hypothetical protein